MMKKKPRNLRVHKPAELAQSDGRHWHNGGGLEMASYAQALHRTAKALVSTLDPEPNSNRAWDACPVVLLYREAVELHLKELVDAGCHFLPSPTDSLSLAKTRSLRWLAQIVCQILKAVGWENEFKCEGVASLADFNALLSELEALNPVEFLRYSWNRRPDQGVPAALLPHSVSQIAKRLDSLLDLLAVTADALAAEWDRVSAEETLRGWDDVTPTIQ